MATAPAFPPDLLGQAAWYLTPLQLARRAAILLSMYCLLAAFALLCRRRAARAPSRSMVAFVFLALFCAYEITYRSVELFTVHIGWGRQLLATEDAAARMLIEARIQQFQQVVAGIYHPLLSTQLVGSAVLLLTVGRGAAEWLLALALGVKSSA